MKKNIQRIRASVLALLLAAGISQTQAQFVNGDFQQPGSHLPCFPTPTGITGWAFSQPNTPQYTNIGPPANYWIDLTVCGGPGNGAWIEQNVTTVAGKLYFIQLSLGTWNMGYSYDAGVDIQVNGVNLNAGATRLVNSTFGSPGTYLWKTVKSCVFRATGSTTTVRIIGNGQNPVIPDPGAHGPEIIGLDSVKLKEVELNINSTEDLCKHCFSVQGPPDITVSNVNWYVNGVLTQSNSNNFCHKPTPPSTQLQAEVTVNNSCGTITHTVSLPVIPTSDCICDLSGKVSLNSTQTGCNTYDFNLAFNPEYQPAFTSWSIDGALVNGQLTALTISTLSPGPHVICATGMAGLVKDPGSMCCNKICTTVSVSPVSTLSPVTTVTQVVAHCPITSPTGFTFNPCTANICNGSYFEYWQDGTLVSSNICQDYAVNNGSEFRCYDVLAGGARCLKKIVTISTVSKQPREYTCSTLIENCDSELNDPLSFTDRLTCGSCKRTVLNATYLGPWTHLEYKPINRGTRIMTREYVNETTCEKCTVTFSVINSDRGSVPPATINLIGESSYAMPLSEFPDCFYGKSFKVSLLDNSGYVVDVLAYSASIWQTFPPLSIELSCDNSFGVVDPTYYISSDEDPCCFMIITLDCNEDGREGLRSGKPGQNKEPGSSTKASTSLSKLSIVPNPTSSIFRIASSKGYETYRKVEISDMSGKVLVTKENINSNTELNVTKFDKGTYFVNVQTESGVVSLKLISQDE